MGWEFIAVRMARTPRFVDTVVLMLEFGLTGGIGSGKSTVSAMLADHGAVIIDADAIVRDLQRPNELVFESMVERWGDQILQQPGDQGLRELDRAAVAQIVFNDEDELAALNAIVHPAVFEESARRLAAVAANGVVVHDIPLLVHPGGEVSRNADLSRWAGVIVVDTPVELAVARVVAARGMEPEEVAARMDAQATREERASIADLVIDNSGSLDDLVQQVDRCWAWMLEQRADQSNAQASVVDGEGEQ